MLPWIKPGNRQVIHKYSIFSSHNVSSGYTGPTTCFCLQCLEVFVLVFCRATLVFCTDYYYYYYLQFNVLSKRDFSSAVLCILIFFTVPLLSRVCPSDVCRIWKSGASLRVDATLLGFENMTWIRGRRSYIFRGDGACFCQRRPKSYQTPSHNLYQFWLMKVGSLNLCLK